MEKTNPAGTIGQKFFNSFYMICINLTLIAKLYMDLKNKYIQKLV